MQLGETLIKFTDDSLKTRVLSVFLGVGLIQGTTTKNSAYLFVKSCGIDLEI